MSLFTSLLHNLKEKIDAEHAYKDVVVKVIKEVVGVTITTDAIISCKDGVLTMKLHPTIRSAVILKQGAVIEVLQGRNLQVNVIR